MVPPDNPLAALDAPFLQAGERILPLLKKKIDIDEFTPMVSLSFDVTDAVMTYFSYSEGFKSGGFTQRVFPPIVAGFTAPPGTPDIDLIPTYEPEDVKVYELGFKTALLDERLRFNGAIFHTKYEDLQVQVFNSVAPVTQNIGKATIDGLELELQAAPGDGWLVEASLSYLDAEYDRIDTGVTLIGEDFDFERVPEYTGSLGVSKEFALDDLGFLVVRADWSYRDDTYNDAYNTEILEDRLLQPGGRQHPLDQSRARTGRSPSTAAIWAMRSIWSPASTAPRFRRTRAIWTEAGSGVWKSARISEAPEIR